MKPSTSVDLTPVSTDFAKINRGYIVKPSTSVGLTPVSTDFTKTGRGYIMKPSTSVGLLDNNIFPEGMTTPAASLSGYDFWKDSTGGVPYQLDTPDGSSRGWYGNAVGSLNGSSASIYSGSNIGAIPVSTDFTKTDNGYIMRPSLSVDSALGRYSPPRAGSFSGKYSPFSAFDAEGAEGTMKLQFGYLSIDPETGIEKYNFCQDNHSYEWEMEPGNPYNGFTPAMEAAAKTWEPELRERFAEAFPEMLQEDRAAMVKFTAAGWEYLEAESSPSVPKDRPYSNCGAGLAFETADGNQYFMEFGWDPVENKRIVNLKEVTEGTLPIGPRMFSYMELDPNRWWRAMQAGNSLRR